MHILMVNDTVIPAVEYGGTERIIWWLGQELVRRGHRVTYLVKKGSTCPFADIRVYNPDAPVDDQVPEEVDLVHLNFQPRQPVRKPYLMTHHGNAHWADTFDANTVFVSRNHAERNGSNVYVRNGVDPDEFGPVDFSKPREHLLFLAYAKRPEKNLKACSRIARKSGHVLAVVGGKGHWYKWRPWMAYKGFLGGHRKIRVLQNSLALLFPVRWHEPCGLAMLEALYFGCPVLGTRYGSLPELITPDLGFLSNSCRDLIDAVKHLDRYNPRKIHSYTCDCLNTRVMTEGYLKLYEKVLDGHVLNDPPPVNGGNYAWGDLLPFEM